MPEIPERRNPQPQGMDEVPEANVGSYAYTPHELTQKERAAYRRELKEKEARRIRPGFAIPPTEEERGTAADTPARSHPPERSTARGGHRGAARGHRRAPARGRGTRQVRRG